MNEKLDTKCILVYLAFAFGMAWTFALIVYLTGGLINSPQLIPGTGITLALVLLATGYMWAPALAHILTRLLTREGWAGTFLRPRFKHGWPYWVAAWLLPGLMTISGAAFFYALYPHHFDPSLGFVRGMLGQVERLSGQPSPITPWGLVALQTVIAILISPLVNGVFTFGEEFGWRAYLQPRLMPLGGRKAMLLMGLIWGVWHWPVIAMGHNYGLDYPGAPWLGLLAMVWFTLVVGTFLGWVAWRGGSVWPAVIGHAAINGISGLGVLFSQGEPNPLLGPMPVGVVASAAWAALALWIFLNPGALGAPGAEEQ